jgi:hypothetical protein
MITKEISRGSKYEDCYVLYSWSIKICHEQFLKRQYHEIFSSNNSPWAREPRTKAFLNCVLIREDFFNREFFCMRRQWHRMHEILLGSPLKIIYFNSSGVGPFGNLSVFDRYSLSRLPGPLESFCECVHAVSYFAFCVNYTAWIFHFFCIEKPVFLHQNN